MSLARVVQNAVAHHHAHSSTPENVEPNTSSWPESSPHKASNHSYKGSLHSGDPVALDYWSAGEASDYIHLDAQSHDSQGLGSGHRIPYYRSPTDTPATRTGPPRSLSFAYSFSPSLSRHNSGHQLEFSDLHPTFSYENSDRPFSRTDSDFRGVLEPFSSRDQVSNDRKGKRRESRSDDGWSVNPIRWFHESPREESSKNAVPWRSPVPESIREDGENTVEQDASDKLDGQPSPPDDMLHPPTRPLTNDEVHRPASTSPQTFKGLRRAFSLPHTHTENKTGKARWAKLRSLLPNIQNQGNVDAVTPTVAVTSPKVNITDELITGGLSTLILRLYLERDEKGHRRVPILLHRLRIRISDSYHPTEEKKTVFRIECEYANGAARWVIYRQLRDFFSLHTHYTVSNVYNRLGDELPEFPLTSIPYLKFLKKEDASIDQASFARLRREVLETYLIKLIRAVMFHPSSNRLSGFLEVSALSISLAQSGGAQYKGGYLQVHAINNGGGGFGRKGLSWKVRRELRWSAVRESYLVVVDEPGEINVWDVFLFDPDFKIERPKRYYRQDEHNEDSNTSSAMSLPARSRAPMLDPSTNLNPVVVSEESRPNGDHAGQVVAKRKKNPEDVSKHTFYIVNSQMRLKLFARSERQMLQWITALERSASSSPYTGRNRFDSFAPIRLNVAAQWLVDGRDYFWNLSRAILLAKHVIYIHDWWLSPELLLRRPGKDRYRLDHLLERKAKEGVKIYVILYQEVSNRTTPTDSNYAKQRLMGLHPNIMVQRSPSHFQTGTFYWAHHEKICVIDQAIAFMGGIDLCFGRWDTPQHILVDDVDGTDRPEIWPGKDYSNPRISDFHTLNKPDEDMYDRSKCPRMPWHDVAMQIVGQPARDLARHFVQRWNYLLRIKNHTRIMSFLLPPPEFKPGELTQMGLTGTCEMQICRSAGPWSMGTPTKVEHSIQNAYLKAIQMSEHFVYIENQFFITSTTVNDVKIENNIGDAIVHRIIKAHKDGTPWKCCIVIPLLPGFTFPVDHSDASAIRIILECQNRTIARGSNSIFSRLRKEGIDPDEYINVFSLRNWARMRGDVLTTEQVFPLVIFPPYVSSFGEQVYIHGKVCIVDDRLAIIGSANINERSQRGDRDSEIAAVIRDTDMIDGTMAGQPFKVGRFAHTLRIRLMREHLGVDVDALDEEDLMVHDPVQPEHEQRPWDPEVCTGIQEDTSAATTKKLEKTGPKHGASDDGARDATLKAERQDYTMEGEERIGFASSEVPTIEERTIADERPPSLQADAAQEESKTADNINTPKNGGSGSFVANGTATEPLAQRPVDDREGHDGTSNRNILRKQRTSNSGSKWTVPIAKPHVDPSVFEDPISDAFWKNVWVASAAYNTEIYRKVFHAVPDDTVTSWKQYKEFVAHHERLKKPSADTGDPTGRVPSEAGDDALPPIGNPGLLEANDTASETDRENSSDQPHTPHAPHTPQSNLPSGSRRPAKGTEPFEKWERDEMESLLKELNGHLGMSYVLKLVYPTRFLEGEDIANNFLFNADRLLPLPIYD
ncbi:Phospholipase D1 [Leucoagaricus sp. SymC.cos]|nr:Phospholipase D1 [Leucoagaricus sp. SymC.cos]